MKYLTALCVLFVLIANTSLKAKTYLFVLSGQSNMARMDPEVGFTPTLKAALEPNEIIVVKNAVGGQPIMRWDKDWEPGKGDWPQPEKKRASLYNRLMRDVNAAIKGKQIDCITFVWMQGEKDANTGNGDVYEASFKRVVKQLEDDLGVSDINVVYGRLSDFKTEGDWAVMRELQVAMAEANPHWEWVDTDDLNGETNDIHYLAEGAYKTFGERLAEKALKLIKAYCD